MIAEEELVLFANALVIAAVDMPLSDLQIAVLRGALAGQTYEEIARSLGYSEPHIKDMGANLWKLVSQALRLKVIKSNCRTHLESAYTARQVQDISKLPSLVDIQQPKLAPTFVGREGAIADLNSLMSQGAKVIVIQASGGVGKTTLALQYFKTLSFDIVLELWVAKETQYITSVEGVIEEWLRRDLNEEPGQEVGIMLGRLRHKLRNPSCKVGILIDNLETLLDFSGKLIESHRSYIELLRVLSDPFVQSVTLITSRERLQESDITVQHYLLKNLELSAWQQFFESRQIQTDTPALTALHRAYGGNAKAMEILSSVIQEDFAGNSEAYWQANQEYLFIERNLEDLVVNQFNRLQQLDVNAYNLLCRMGCYRYQDVSAVAIEGLLCLLWDVPETIQRRTAKALQDKSLVSFENGKYSLHPVIQAEALNRLRQSKDWETTNQKAAEFWTESIKTIETINDAKRALEAYFHYMEIESFEQAGQVLIKERVNSWNTSFNSSTLQESSLCGSFCRLGLFLQIHSAITQVITKIKSDFILCKLYNTLGEVNWRLGSLRKAIVDYQKSREMADYHRYEYIVVDSSYNIGRCYIELGELQEAVKIFEDVIKISENTKWHTRAVCASFYLAFIYSYLGQNEISANIADKVEREISVNPLGVKSTGYRLLFLGLTFKNLKRYEMSLNMLQSALSYAKEVDFPQLLGKAINGLADLYREKHDFKAALDYSLEAIKILDKLGAKADLAEAYFQRGLTYQQIGERVKGNEYISRAVQLFEGMEAPEQVKKILQALKAEKD
ncbi:NB-ARC domain-containing protein [Scytonema sp. NUACC21]